MAGPPQTLIGRTVGNFRIESVIGEGGMGKVYCAVQPSIGSRVAIKVLSEGPKAPKNLTERFFSEARAVNVIGHENIVNVIDLTYIDGRAAIIMEYLKGESLMDLLRRRDQLPFSVAVDLMLDVLAALSAAHDQGIIHRDLKPANIFVSPEGRAKVLDFGVAKMTGDAVQNPARTDVGIVLGTIPYMAPEQVQGLPLDGRCDLFAVGAVLYECVCGRRPYRGATVGKLIEEHREGFEPPGLLRKDIPKSLEDVIERSLASERHDRFVDAAVMAGALRGVRSELREETIDFGQPRDPDSELALASTGPASREGDNAPPSAEESSDEIETSAETPNAKLDPISETRDLRPLSKRRPPVAPADEPRTLRRVWIALALVAIAGGLAAFVLLSAGDEEQNEQTAQDPSADAAATAVSTSPADAGATAVIELDAAVSDARLATPVDGTSLLGTLPAARELALTVFEDAQLYSFTSFRVDESGVVPNGSTASYYFLSPSQYGDSDECVVYVTQNLGKLTAKRTSMAMCNRRKPPAQTPAPKCTIREVFERARALGLVGDPSRSLEWVKIRFDESGWQVRVGLKGGVKFPDFCEPEDPAKLLE